MPLSSRPHDAGIDGFLFLFLLLLVASAVVAAEASVEVVVIRQPSLNQNRLPAELERRDEVASCPSSEYASCGSQVPSNFCCPREDKCVVLAANTTVMCCPLGDCNTIRPIVCNLSLQDVSKYSDAPVLTTALDEELPRCGSGCCPFGFSCNSKNHCEKDDNQEDYLYLVPKLSTTSAPVTTSTMPPETSTTADIPQVQIPSPTATETTGSSTAEASTAETSTAETSTAEMSTAETSTAETSTAETSTAATSTAETSKAEDESKLGGVSPAGLVTATTVAGVCCLTGIAIFIWMRWGRKTRSSRESFTHHRDSGWGSWSSWPCFSGPGGQSPLLPQHLVVKRGLDDKFIVTPSEAEFSPRAPPVAPRPPDIASPVELPASPVSLCMWQNLENAQVQEPKLAYVVPAKQRLRRW